MSQEHRATSGEKEHTHEVTMGGLLFHMTKNPKFKARLAAYETTHATNNLESRESAMRAAEFVSTSDSLRGLLEAQQALQGGREVRRKTQAGRRPDFFVTLVTK